MSKDNGMRIGWIGTGRMGAALVEAAARRGLRRRGLQPHAQQGRGAGRARRDRSSTRPPTWPTATSSSRWSGASDDFKEVVIGAGRRPLARRRRPAHADRLDDDLARRRPTTSARSRPSAAPPSSPRPCQRQREGRRRRPADDGRLRPRGRVRSSAATCSSRFGRKRHLRRRGRPRPARQDLPQPDARRRRADARRDHRAGREGRRRRAPTSSRSSTTASWARCSRATRRPRT